MQKIFNQEIRFKDDNGKDFEEWEEKNLGSLCKITTGKLDANAMVEDGEYRFYTCAKDYYRMSFYKILEIWFIVLIHQDQIDKTTNKTNNIVTIKILIVSSNVLCNSFAVSKYSQYFSKHTTPIIINKEIKTPK